MVSEIKFATISVADLARTQQFYEKTFDYVVHGRGSVGGEELEQLWRMPAGMSGDFVVLAPSGATGGLVRLVAFDRPGRPYWGDYSSAQDYGFYALNIRVPQLSRSLERLTHHGGKRRSTPTRWQVTPDLSAWDSLSFDPDGVLLDVFELEPTPGSLLDGYDGRCSEIQTVAVHSSDARRSASFYAALGFRPWYDKMLEGMESFFELPEGTVLHNINLMAPASPSVGRVEIAQYVGFPGRSQRDTAVPPALGLLSVSLETDDLELTTTLLDSIGGERVSPTIEASLPGLGGVRACTYHGPDGELLEFYERLHDQG